MMADKRTKRPQKGRGRKGGGGKSGGAMKVGAGKLGGQGKQRGAVKSGGGTLGGGALDAGKLGGGTLGGGVVDAGKLGGGAVDAGKLGEGAVDAGKLGGGAVDAGKLGGAGKPEGGGEERFDPEVLALGKEIRTLLGDDDADSVKTWVEGGRRLEKVHKQLVHGQWLRFLTEEVGCGRVKAWRMIRLSKWARDHPQILARVRRLGPTRLRPLVEAPPRAVRALLARRQHVVPGTTTGRRLLQLSENDLAKVLRTLAGDEPEQEVAARVEAEEVLGDLQREARGVVRWTNKLVKLHHAGKTAEALDDDELAEAVAEVQKKLLRSLKKLDKTFGPAD